MSNFTLQDVAGSAIGVVAFALALYVPGYVVGYAADLAGFRRAGLRERTLWAVAISFAVTPIAGYLLGKYAGLNAACGVLCGLGCVWLVLLWRRRREFAWTRTETLAACAAGAWIALVVASLVDIQVGHRLYFSVVEDDQSYRVAFTNAVLRTGVPPANPLYFPGHAQAMRYYYFWYVLCAMVARIANVTARQAFIASNVWVGFGMVAALGLFMRHFLGVVESARRQTAIAIGLLAVTGADLLPALGAMAAGTPLNGDMEWWSNDQISSWADSLLWVPHHVASLVCCAVVFLLLWMSKSVRGRERVGLVVVAALAFASGFGLSIYVAFGFAVLMLAWMARLAVRKDFAMAGRAGLTGLLGGLMLTPFLRELLSDASQASANARGGAGDAAGRLFTLSVRRLIDPSLLTGLPMFAAWNRTHPALLDVTARLLLLPLGLALELGFYGAVLWIYARQRKSFAADGPQRTALYLAGCGLAIAVFVRSAMIGNNDFGYRAALLPQFFLLVLAEDLLGSWWIEGRAAVVAKTVWRRRVVYGLIALGVAGTVYQVTMLRMFLPLESSQAGSAFAALPTEAYAVRRGFGELHRVASEDAVVEFNPIDSHDPDWEHRGYPVAPYTFYVRAMLMDAGRQVLSGEMHCAAQFGGDLQRCAEVESSTLRLYAKPAPSAQWAEDYCREFGAEYLAVGTEDAVWGDTLGWEATLPVVADEDGFRIVRCGGS